MVSPIYFSASDRSLSETFECIVFEVVDTTWRRVPIWRCVWNVVRLNNVRCGSWNKQSRAAGRFGGGMLELTLS